MNRTAYLAHVAPLPATTPCSIRLTPKELEALRWALQGKTAWEISRIQGRSEATINFHLGNIRRKFGVNSLCAAMVKAIELRVIQVT